ncbi:MAG: pyrroloquinoline quinone biosynthesis protein PqqE [Betaproteobacteria bacterium]|nr:pyrroloquinoline quinone biosynthesis protein PqqE [Betaproteobacteria bacterium]
MNAPQIGAVPALAANAAAELNPPLWLLAEVTYRCPLHCVFCYNPVDFEQHKQELSTDDWLRVLREGRAMGAVQCGFSGGEPLLRDDLEVLVAEARQLGYYTNLITSGVGLTEARAERFKAAGLDHIQLSFQDSTREVNDLVTRTRTFGLKQEVAHIIKANGWPMVINVVIHRLNIEHIGRIIEMAAELGAEYLELANTQYYSWAFVNRDQLLPTRDQLIRAEQETDRWREKLGDKMRIFFVSPDYHEAKPKKCMNGWGNVFLTITPDGTALPCHTARMLPGLSFPNVRDMGLKGIWFDSEGFNHYRGTGWMKEPCASCEDKEKDLGGCRCQAYLLSQDPDVADPVCPKSPHHHLVEKILSEAETHAASGVDAAAPWGAGQNVHPLIFRGPQESRSLSSGSK